MLKTIQKQTDERPFDHSTTFVFHKVTNSLITYKSDIMSVDRVMKVFGHYDMMLYLNESCLYTHTVSDPSGTLDHTPIRSDSKHHKCSSNDLNTIVEANRRVAMNAGKMLTLMNLSRIDETMYMIRKQSQKHFEYIYFSPSDCTLIK